MVRPAVLLGLALAALLAPGNAGAKEFVSMVVVGSDGRSIELRPGWRAIDGFFDHRSSPRPRAQPRGAYVKLYPLGQDGFPGIPGRFYPRTGAVCFAWPGWTIPTRCVLATRSQLQLLVVSRGLALFQGPRTALSSLSRTGLALANLVVAIELSFERWALARPASRPTRCLRFAAGWRGPQAARRPRRFCLSARGAYARGRLYPYGPAVWRFLVLNGQ